MKKECITCTRCVFPVPAECDSCVAGKRKNYTPTIEHFVSEAVRLHSFAHPDGQRYINAGDLVMMVSDMKIAKES